MSAGAVATGVGEEVPHLFFASGGERFAVDLAYVRGILPDQPVTPVPLVPPTVAGIINHRGTVHTVIRFSRLARLDGEGRGGIILLRLPDMAVGFAVERVEGIERLPGALLAAGGAAALPDLPFLRRVTDADGRLIHAIDAERLIDTIYQLPDLIRAGDGERAS